MNIFEDYVNYMGECQELIEKMIEQNSSIYYVLSDVIKVTDHIYQMNERKESLDEDLEEIFEIGYGYLSNVLADLKTYYEDYFDKNMDLFNYYSELMLYSVNIEDYLDHLIVQELGNEELEKKLRDINYEIDNMLVNKKPYDEAYVVNLDARIEELKLANDGYKPVYNVFRMIAETLELE